MHHYTEQPGDISSEQLYPNGMLHSVTVVSNGKPANGWSSKTYYPEVKLHEEENYSNGILIEKITYDENGMIARHKIWNNRLRLLIDKVAVPKLPRPNVVAGHGSLTTYLNALPVIAIFIGAEFDKASLLTSYDTFLKTDDEDQNWRLEGKEMNFTIYWEQGELSYQWHCHCYTEERYWKARLFLEKIL